MTYPRSHLVDSENAAHYHLVSRCVRRAFLCGEDPVTGQDYSHRKQWILDRTRHLAGSYALSINSYAVLSNHFHLAVRFDPQAAWTWTDEEVADRWLKAFPPRVSNPANLERALNRSRKKMFNDPDLLTKRRAKLGSLSHFMKSLKENIARRANIEDGCTGHFFEGRFYSGVLLDVEAVTACMAYVDLNPIKAGTARTLEECELSSIFARIKEAETDPDVMDRPMEPLVSGLGDRTTPVPVVLRAYVDDLQLSSQYLNGAIDDAPPWVARMMIIGFRQKAYGSSDAMKAWATKAGQKWICGVPMDGDH